MILLESPDHRRKFNGLSFTPDGAEVVAHANWGKLWRLAVGGGPETRVPLGSRPDGEPPDVEALCFALGGGRLFVGTTRGMATIRPPVWEPESFLEPEWTVGAVALGPDGGMLVAGATRGGRYHLSLGRLSDAGAFEESHRPPISRSLAGAAFTADGVACLECDYSRPPWGGAACEWSAVTFRNAFGAVRHTARSPLARTQGMAASPDGRRVVVVAGGSLLLWDAADPERPPVKVRNRSLKFFKDAAFHPSGRHFAATTNDEAVTLYDAVSGAELRRFAWRIGRVRSVAFSPDGALAAAGGDAGKIVVWDVEA